MSARRTTSGNQPVPPQRRGSGRGRWRRFGGHLAAAGALALSVVAAGAQVSNAPVTPGLPNDAGARVVNAKGGAGESPDPNPSVCARRDPKNGIYHPDRLTVINPCQTVTGTIADVKKEADGDYHIRVTLDTLYKHLTNSVNDAKQHGDLVVEIPCVNTVTQADAVAACTSIDVRLKLTAPAIGQHVSITGPYVNDGQHGWMEIHPVYEWHALP